MTRPATAPWMILALCALPACGGSGSLYHRTCSQCHDAGLVLHLSRTPDQWREIVERMSDHRKYTPAGEIPEAERKAIVDYLVRKAGE